MKNIVLKLSPIILSLAFACTPPTVSKNELKKETASEVKKEESVSTITTLKSGNFQDAVHKVSGVVKIVKNDIKNQILLTNFNTEAGPDLHVYLVKNETGDASKNDSFLNLGKLASNTGEIKIDIPDGTNINEYKSVSIWCKFFSVNFGFAKIN